MDLSISPDVEAFYCYLIVLIIGVAVGKNRVSGLLTGFRGAWVLLDTWALLVVYSLLPVILFWLLDRSDALHDTSLFGAILVAVAYRQILAGGVQGVAAPGQITKAWQPLVDWTDRVAARIRDRIQRNTTRYDERVVSKLVQDKPKLEELTSLVQSYGTNPTDVENQLRTLATAFGALGPAGVLRKQASFLYQRLKVIPNLDFEYAMYQQGITSKFQYYWYAKEWHSKTLALAVTTAILFAGLWVFAWLRTPENVVRYYVWRLHKSNASAYDRYRSRERLTGYMRGPEGGRAARETCARITTLLRYEALPVETADSMLTFLVSSRALIAQQQVRLPSLLIDSLRTANPDVRVRIHKTLLLLAQDQGISLPGTLSNWTPSREDSTQDLENRVREWLDAWKGH